jgi:predicted deacylase
MSGSRIACTIDLGAKGKAWGRLAVPLSRHESAYGHVPIPIAAVVGGPGPTVLLSGGVHGDEYEGQIEIARFVQEIDPAEVTGRVIALPSANLPAALAGRRTSPVDEGNLARLFPGERDGRTTAQIAHYIESELIPLADASLDIHAGGSSLDYLPATLAREGGPGEEADIRAALAAFGAPYGALMGTKRLADGRASSHDDRTLLAAAARRGVPGIAAEMGGAGTARPSTLEITRRGIRNMLAHWGVLGSAAFDAGPVEAVDVRPEHHLFAPRRGVFAPLFDLGDRVEPGALAGHVHDLEQPERPGEPVYFGAGGTVLARRVPARVEPGDCLAQLCERAGG